MDIIFNKDFKVYDLELSELSIQQRPIKLIVIILGEKVVYDIIKRSYNYSHVYFAYTSNKKYNHIGLIIKKHAMSLDSDNEIRILEDIKTVEKCKLIKGVIFREKFETFTIMFKADGDIHSLLFEKNKGYDKFNHENKLKLLGHIIDTILCLAMNEYYYTDLKLENILYTYDNLMQTFNFYFGDLGSISKPDAELLRITYVKNLNEQFLENPFIMILIHLFIIIINLFHYTVYSEKRMPKEIDTIEYIESYYKLMYDEHSYEYKLLLNFKTLYSSILNSINSGNKINNYISEVELNDYFVLFLRTIKNYIEKTNSAFKTEKDISRPILELDDLTQEETIRTFVLPKYDLRNVNEFEPIYTPKKQSPKYDLGKVKRIEPMVNDNIQDYNYLFKKKYFKYKIKYLNLKN